jgi:DNA processing protein
MPDAAATFRDTVSEDSLLTLAAALGHATRALGELLREGVDPGAILDGDPRCLARLPGAAAARLPVGAPRRRRLRDWLGAELERCAARFVPFGATAYPAALRGIPDPPPWLYCRGDISCLAMPQVAVVGSRRASQAGLQLAEALAARLAGGGYGVCSGMALGIDGAAHRGALQRGHTVAVLGTGIDHCYPVRHAKLAEQIVARGCLVSEMPPGTAAHPGQFPRRNRIISGLAQATVIVEAALPSGSLHTAAAALEQGREVFVFPWSVLHGGGAGCLYLLRDGATPLTSLEELEEHFPLLAGASGGEPDDEGAADLLTLIGDGSPSLQALQTASGLSPAALLALLGRLEADGLVRRADGGYTRAHSQ